jgi:hypothetical protein
MHLHLIDMQDKNSREFQGKTNFNPRAQFRLAVIAAWNKQLTLSTGRSLARIGEGGGRQEGFIANVIYKIIYRTTTLILSGITTNCYYS